MLFIANFMQNINTSLQMVHNKLHKMLCKFTTLSWNNNLVHKSMNSAHKLHENGLLIEILIKFSIPDPSLCKDFNFQQQTLLMEDFNHHSHQYHHHSPPHQHPQWQFLWHQRCVRQYHEDDRPYACILASLVYLLFRKLYKIQNVLVVTLQNFVLLKERISLMVYCWIHPWWRRGWRHLLCSTSAVQQANSRYGSTSEQI